MAALASGAPRLGHLPLYPSAASPWSSSILRLWTRPSAAPELKLSANTSHGRMWRKKMHMIFLEGQILERIITTRDGGGGMSGSEAEDHHHQRAGLLSTRESAVAVAATATLNAHLGKIEIADQIADERWLAVVRVRRLQGPRNVNQEAGVGVRAARHRLHFLFRPRQITCPCRPWKWLGMGRWDGGGDRLRRCLQRPAHGSQGQTSPNPHPIASLHQPVDDNPKFNLHIPRGLAANHAAAPAHAPHRHPRGSAAVPWEAARLVV